MTEAPTAGGGRIFLENFDNSLAAYRGLAAALLSPHIGKQKRRKFWDTLATLAAYRGLAAAILSPHIGNNIKGKGENDLIAAPVVTAL